MTSLAQDTGQAGCMGSNGEMGQSTATHQLQATKQGIPWESHGRVKPEMPMVGRKPPACESKSEGSSAGRHEGQAGLQTAPSKWSRGSRLPCEFLDAKQTQRREEKVAVFKAQGKEGRDQEEKQQGWSEAEPWKMRRPSG